MNYEIIAIHENSKSDMVIKFIDLDSFSSDFQNEYENGNIYGVYYDANKIVASTIDGNVLENIL